ncbi:hypothetical protein FOA52_002289 [Chlamydomonas sp. UWO 241]|nr:hypothetical protein FOA52_002289 [Chlamydomonas sp. UWO 241]
MSQHDRVEQLRRASLCGCGVVQVPPVVPQQEALPVAALVLGLVLVVGHLLHLGGNEGLLKLRGGGRGGGVEFKKSLMSPACRASMTRWLHRLSPRETATPLSATTQLPCSYHVATMQLPTHLVGELADASSDDRVDLHALHLERNVSSSSRSESLRAESPQRSFTCSSSLRYRRYTRTAVSVGMPCWRMNFWGASCTMRHAPCAMRTSGVGQHALLADEFLGGGMGGTEDAYSSHIRSCCVMGSDFSARSNVRRVTVTSFWSTMNSRAYSDMPVVCLQVGQCGNQLGQALWSALDQQCSQDTANLGLNEAGTFFRADRGGRRTARALLIDTEPKVVNGVLASPGGRSGLFSPDRAFVGHSGRGSNWAFGYNQALLGEGGGGATTRAQQPRTEPGEVPWNRSAHVEEAGQEEHHILEHVIEGVRAEAEACDGCPDFLMLHSLGGGSGSGLGCRLLEAIRDEHGGLPNVATASVAPHPQAGESPMQCVNAVLALSMLQAYSDVVMLFDNQEMLESAGKSAGGGRGASMADVNGLIAHHVMGAVWPMDAAEVHGGTSRIRDMVGTVAADPCTKIVTARTAAAPAGTPAQGAWAAACKALHTQLPRFDALDHDRPVTTSGALVLSRGFPGVAGAGASAAAAAYVKAGGGASAFGAGGGRGSDGSSNAGDMSDAVWLRASPGGGAPAGVVAAWPGNSGGTSTSSARGGGGGATGATGAAAAASARGGGGGAAAAPSVASVSLRSSTVGLLDATAQRATATWSAGAYMHWYERHGCPAEAVRTAIEGVNEVADCYRAAHGIQDWLDDE